ncbi:MAG: endoribonuclease MazF [Candidatus Hydrogenedentes bacterium]|nr:endoribonuclease MazF [Candidatus Hydrogenedentota bacterium]
MVDQSNYVPKPGDVIWISFDPQAGREQSGRRPALVLSPVHYNKRSGLCLCCPITSRVKSYPFEVSIPGGLKVQGAILADHIRSLDWRVRGAEFMCVVSDSVCREVVYRITGMLDRGN